MVSRRISENKEGEWGLEQQFKKKHTHTLVCDRRARKKTDGRLISHEQSLHHLSSIPTHFPLSLNCDTFTWKKKTNRNTKHKSKNKHNTVVPGEVVKTNSQQD